MNSSFLPPLPHFPVYKDDNLFGLQTTFRAIRIESSESKLYVLTLAQQAEEHARIWEKLSEGKKREFCKLMPFTRPYSKREGRGDDGSQIIHFPDQSFRVSHPQQQDHQAVLYDIKSHNGKHYSLQKTGSEGIPVRLLASTRAMLAPYFHLKDNLEKHQLHLMEHWWNRVAWNILGFPVMMPSAISREGLWQVVPQKKGVQDFNCDALALMLNRLLALQTYTSLALTGLLWNELKGHLAEVDGQVVVYSNVSKPGFYEASDWVAGIKKENPELFKKLELPPPNFLKQRLAAFYQKGKVSELHVENELFRLQVLKRIGAYPEEGSSLKAMCARKVMALCFEAIDFYKGKLSDPRFTDALPDGFCDPVHLPQGQARLWDIALILSAWVQAGKMQESEASAQFQSYLVKEVFEFVKNRYNNLFNC